MGADVLDAPETVTVGPYTGQHAVQEVHPEPDMGWLISGEFHPTWEMETYSRHGASQTISVRVLLEFLESFTETLQIVTDRNLMASIRRGVEESAGGKGQPLDEVLAELGWE